jgi:integrase
MTGLRDALAGYLALRRSLGFKLERPGQLLADFTSYLEAAGAPTVTTELALAWATAPADADPTWWRARLAAVRPFARYLATRIPGTEVPPAGLLPGPLSRRAVPYLYSPASIAGLLAAAGTISSPLRAATYQTFIGLLAVTGMRAGEAIGLDRSDVDLTASLLTIRQSKFGKSRQLPVHATTVAALAGYAALRDQHHPRPATPAFFISLTGTRLIYKNVHYTFRRLTRAAGLAPRSAQCRPRIHDLRHSFAVTTLLRWYQDGGDVAARLPLLSAYLGHADPGGTYWYLTGTPELLALAAARLEAARDAEEPR